MLRCKNEALSYVLIAEINLIVAKRHCEVNQFPEYLVT